MAEVMTINNPVMDIINQLSYSGKVAKIFWENTNTVDTQDRTTTKLIDKRMDFLTYNLERMIDLPKLKNKNFNRTEATATALSLDRMKQMFSGLEKQEIREVLEILEVLRK